MTRPVPSLTDRDLDDIRRQSILVHLELARRYGVSTACIEAIAKGRPWQRLAEEKPTIDLFEQGEATNALPHSLCRRPV